MYSFDADQKFQELKNYYLNNSMDYDKKTGERKPYTVRRAENEARKDIIKFQADLLQKPVSQIEISIEWKKSRTWGANPHLYAFIRYADGSTGDFNSTCSGCGYDKESTVIARLFNYCLKYRLYDLLGEEKNTPYGISLVKEDAKKYPASRPYYDGGIGTECYYSISEAIGGNFERVASGKTYDAYTFTMN